MRLRKQELGDRNLVGSRVEAVRKQKGMKQKELLAQLQVNGVDMNASGLSKLEGQIRFVTDVELVALADILEVRSEAFADLLNHVSPEVREIARTKLSLLNRSIRENREREAEEYNRREQRFE